MPLFDDWCDNDEEECDKKRLWKLTEKEDGREKTAEFLAETVRSHYDTLERIAEDVEELGYDDASEILRERLPRGKKARSGDLGEILASELTEEKLGFQCSGSPHEIQGRTFIFGSTIVASRSSRDWGLLQVGCDPLFCVTYLLQ